MRFTPLFALALLGCRQASPPAPTEPEAPSASAAASTEAPAPATAPAPAGQLITEPHSLVGEYRIAGVDGAEIDLPYGLAAELNEDGIMIEADCLVLSWVYFFEDTRLVTEQLAVRASCGRELRPAEHAIVTAFNSATKVTRTAANGIAFSGGGHSVLLFSQ